MKHQRRLMDITVSGILIAALAGTFLARFALGENKLTAQDIIARNIQAAGGPEALARIQTFSFKAGVEAYTLSTDGRMKVQLAFEDPAVYEVIVVDGNTVRRNKLNCISEITGLERGRWLCLARLFSGLFTLKNFKESPAYAGIKSFGPERHHVLSLSTGDIRATFYIDAGDWLVKRMVLVGRDTAGEVWEQSCELGSAVPFEGSQVPSAIYFSQVGVSGTYSLRPQSVTGIRLRENLPPGYFTDLGVNSGLVTIAGGILKGYVLGAEFYPEDCFVRVFTNFVEEDARGAGFQNGDLIVLSSGGAQFESRFFATEDKINDPTVFAPGNSFFTRSPTRFPVFYIQFNTLLPKERFENLKSRIKVLSPLQAHRK